MRIYARIDSGLIAEIIEPLLDDAANEIPVEERFTSTIVESLIDITDVSPQPQEGWTVEKKNGSWSFSQPD